MGIVYRDKKIQDWLHLIRLEELKSVVRYLPKLDGLKLLEIGGGDGYLASLLDKEGYQVTSVDLEPRFPQSYPVQKVESSKLSFDDNSFDLIFSSNVLEHVTDLPLLLSELKRVSRPGVVMVHMMPTPAWRIITSFWIYLFLPVRLFKILTGTQKAGALAEEADYSHSEASSDAKVKQSLASKLKRILLHPHGEYPSFIHELYFFSAFRWKRVFKKNNTLCTKVKKGPLLYSGISVFKFKFIGFRSLLSKYFLSSGNIYVISE